MHGVFARHNTAWAAMPGFQLLRQYSGNWKFTFLYRNSVSIPALRPCETVSSHCIAARFKNCSKSQMSKLDKFQKSSIIICVLPIIGTAVAKSTEHFRVGEYRWIYLTGVVIVYLFWCISLLWGLINALFIIYNENQKIKSKILWCVISLIPIFYFTILVSASIFLEPLENDIILPNGEHISQE